ncbi:MAG: hypothetical protein WC455_28455 [Dehalococcoidia bacterium]|jgi:hypothetical protein
MTIQDDLNKLDDMNVTLDAIRLDKRRKIEAAMPEEVRQAIRDIEEEYASVENAASETIAALRKEIVDAVIKNGETVKGAHLQAVYVKGRTSWDTKALDGFAAAHPEIGQFKKIGEPSVSIRP